MRMILCMMFCLISLFCASQQNEKGYSITATSAILFRDFVFQPGFQYTSGSWAVIGEVSHLYAKKLDFDKGYWWRGQVEVKKFLTQGEIRPYFSFQTAYSARKLVTKDSGSFYLRNYSDSVACYRSAVIHSPILSLAPKAGFEIAISKKVFLDWFFGAGARFIFTKYNAQDIRYRVFFRGFKDWDFGPEESWRFDRTLVRFHLVTGLRLGYRF